MVRDVNKINGAILFIFCFIFINTNAQILNTKININVQNQTIEQVLTKITSDYNIAFSYNPESIYTNEIISLNIQNSALQDVLKIILQNNNFELKPISNTIIILAKENSITNKLKYKISGTIINKNSNKPLSNVTVFDVNKLKSTLSDEKGYFELESNSKESFIKLSFSKRGYWDTIIFIKPDIYSNFDIQLNPKPSKVEFISSRKVSDLPNNKIIDELKIVKLATSSNLNIQQENLVGYSEDRIAQTSILPNIGTNRKLSSLIDNKISFNILAGYSNGLKGIEIGGLLNITRQNAEGFQLSGFGNIVGREVKGLQIAGFFNNCTGEVKGVQVAGFSNIVLDTLNGVQLAGFSNIVKGKVKGLQLAGFDNVVTTTIDGGQISGFLNVALDSAGKYQISGFANYGKHLKGTQITGFGNANVGKAKGNQIAGFANLNFGDLDGVQIAGAFNYAKKVKGTQIGFINVADSIDGAALGILSFVKNGYHEVELFYSEMTYANIAFKTGTRNFYNTLIYGEGKKENTRIWKYSYGIGRSQNVYREKLFLDVDLTSGILNYGNGFNQYFSLNSNFKMGFSLKIAGPLHVFVNSNINYYIYEKLQDIPENIYRGSLVKTNSIKYNNRTWVGYNVGLRL